MKRETMQNKLASLLGLEEFKVDKKTGKTQKEIKNYNRPVGLAENEIQGYRFAQAVSYFLQAPQLFTAKVCPHCGENFLVSREYVQFCSYTCIKKDLENKGLTWKRGEDIEALVNSDVYEGNEPLWIRHPEKLREALSYLDSQLASSKPGLLAQTHSSV